MKLIKINTDHFIIVDDSEIKEGDWYISPSGGIISDHNGTEILPDGWKKITHSTQPLEPIMIPRTVLPLSLSEVKELIGEVDVESKVYHIVEQVMGNHNMKSSTAKDMINIGISSYNQALEDNKDRKWTDEDVEAAICFGITLEKFKDDKYRLSDSEELKGFLSLLNQPKTECEVEFIDGKLKLK